MPNADTQTLPNTYIWRNVTANDCNAVPVTPGTYIFEAYGSWGTGALKLGASILDTSAPVPLKKDDGSDWSVSSNTGLVKIGALPGGWVKPQISGGSFTLTIVLTRVDDK